MTIDEAITYHREIAERNKEQLRDLLNKKYNVSDSAMFQINIEIEHNRQLAEWLEELKELRKIKKDYAKGMQTSYATFMYNKAIDDFAEHIRAYYALKKEMGYVATTYDDLIKYIFELAQQLKEGEK